MKFLCAIFLCIFYTLNAQFLSATVANKTIQELMTSNIDNENNFWDNLPKIKRPPKGPNNKPLKVYIGMYLESLGNFQEKKMSFDADLYLYMSWLDPQLKHESDMMMINDDKVRKEIWLPDLYFANAKNAYFHHVTVPNFNLFVRPDGTVSYSSRVTMNVACNLDLINYPMDHQNCFIRVLSYAYIANIINVTWFTEKPIAYNSEIDLPEFSITNVNAEYCNGTYRYALTENSFKQDKFSCLDAHLYLKRSLGYNMAQTYVPTGLIVIISWISFWIDRRAVPARVTLSFTTLVSLTTLGNGLRYSLPQVSYAKAIDYWFGACMLFVFLALLEFALVNSYMRKSEKYEKLNNKYETKNETHVRSKNYRLDKKESEENSIDERQNSSSKILPSRYLQLSHKKSQQALRMDMTSRFLFPGVFILFNVIYWYYYLIYRA